MESTDSSTVAPQPNLPPGFRFHPTDEELLVHYLKKKAASAPLPAAIIAEVDLYKFDPWELPAKATFGEQEWYFFSPRDRKYPNGARPNRAANSGYWKATGTDKPVLTANGTQKVGVKKALVFYGGKPPKGTKTNWIMHEYRLTDNKANNRPPGYNIGNKNNSLRLDDWVLCRIYKKSNTNRTMDYNKDDSMDDMLGPVPPSLQFNLQSSRISFTGLLENDHTSMLDGMVSNEGTMSRMASAGSKAVLPTSTINMHPFTRTLPSLCWNHEETACQLSPTKRFHADTNDGNITRTDGNNSSIATLLTPLPQTPTLHQQTVIGPLGDGALRSPFQLPGMNW